MAATTITVATAHLPPANDEANGGSACAGPFKPCVWGDFFVNYTPPPTQKPEKWMRERADQLRGQVRGKLEASKAMGTAHMLMLVDKLERLGVADHFCKDIDMALSQVHMEELDNGSSNELHIVALRFRLLRQHGFWVSSDVFDKFRDGTGNFREDLSNDVQGLLSLYNAAHMAIPAEKALDDAIAFTRRHLEAAKGNLRSPMSEQVSRALKVPLPRFMPRLEATHFILEYKQEEDHDTEILELATLDYALLNSLHLKELKDLTLWWRDLYEDVKLPYTRDRIVEMYFWAFGIFHAEEYSRARKNLTKIVALISLMDDTYDVHASIEEALKFNEAIQRWDESAVTILPEYLHMVYIKTLSNFREFEDMLEPNKKYGVSYVKEAYKVLSQSYLKEAIWCNQNHVASFREHLHLTAVSAGFPTLSMSAWMGAGHVATEVFEWALSVPEIFRATGEIGRLLNDIAAYKKGKNKQDTASSVECYMKEHGCTGEEAASACAAMVEHAWRKINRASMELNPVLLPAARLVSLGLSQTSEIFYYGGRDAYTYGSDLRDVVNCLFLEPLAVLNW
ncbi:unnamed protein product [Urochloa humidicola]